MLSALRIRWYAASVVAAMVGGVVTIAVYKATGIGYPFIAGFAMLCVILGGSGPAIIASMGTLLVAALYPPFGTVLATTPADAVRLSANIFLLCSAAALTGLWRSSRLATREREAQLRDAASNLQELLDGSNDGIVLTDASYRITYANTMLEQIVGVDRSQLVGQSLETLRAMASERAERLSFEQLAIGASLLVERELRRPDGRMVPVEASVRMLPGRRVLASVRDITTRKRDQERQLAERNLLDGILATSVAGVVVTDLDGTIIFANRRAEDVLGLVRSDSPGRMYEPPAWERIALDGGEWPVENRPYEQVRATGKPVFDVRHGIKWPDGRRMALSVNAAPLHAEDGKMRAVVAAISDITQALAAEEALRERDRQLERITAAMPGMVYKYRRDAEGNERFLYASRSSTLLLEVTPEEIVADVAAAWRYVHPDDSEEMRRSIASSAATLRPWMHEFRVRDVRTSDRWRWLSGRAIPEREPESGAVVWAGILLDVTERRQLEDELRQAQKMESVGRLAGGIAHDFNNLLTAILGHAELLAMDLPPTDDMLESVSQIRAAAESGSALTRQLLGFARKQVVSPQVVAVNALVQRLPPLLRRLVGEAVDLETTLDPLAGNVRVDPAQLDQVLMNLAVNAMDAMPAGGRLQIATAHVPASNRRVEHSTVASGPLVEIIVRDTGHGMTDDVRTRAFEPFFTTKAHGKGTGLGLATSYGIVLQAGGSIFLDSEVGRGTAVRVVLPASDQPLTQERERNGASASGSEIPTGTETILTVDDDPRVRQITAESLRRFGYRVLEAESGLHALEAARREGEIIHLLVTDVVMPGMSGRVLADALLRERPSMRVLYISGYTGGALAQHGVESAGVELLEKPYDQAQLVRRVRRVLDDSTIRLQS